MEAFLLQVNMKHSGAFFIFQFLSKVNRLVYIQERSSLHFELSILKVDLNDCFSRVLCNFVPWKV